ncbi:hypothetical protein K3495_g8678 [Podosphaera aphanis]|nr:hypothetical protein K3495_g8678 [Podosphaera aphanis]
MIGVQLWLNEAWNNFQKYRNSYFLSFVTSFGGMLFGWDTGLIGGILTMEPFQKSFGLRNQSSEEKQDFSNKIGNIVSVLQAGCFLGAMCSFYFSNHFGRKKALFFGLINFFIGSILQTFSGIYTTSLTLLYIGRVIGGVGVGVISAVVPVYIGESVNKEVRGRCIGTMQLFNVTGIMISFFINYGMISSSVAGTSFQWRVPFALQIIPGTFLFMGLVSQNESPRWLVEKGKMTEALETLKRIRGNLVAEAEIMREMQEITTDICGREKLSLAQLVRASCATRSAFHRVSIGTILMFWQQWSGTNSLNYYAPQIFGSIGLEGNASQLFATGIYGVVKVVMTMLTLMLATEQIGRKFSLLIGSAGQVFSMFYLGIHEAMPSSNGISGSDKFAIVCVYTFVVFFSLGWGPIPYVLASECSPNHLRSLSLAIALMVQWLVNFIVARATPVMLNQNTTGTFLFFGACSICGFIYALICVPETTNVPLERINELFEKNTLKGAFFDTFPRYRRSRIIFAVPPESTAIEDRERNCS